MMTELSRRRFLETAGNTLAGATTLAAAMHVAPVGAAESAKPRKPVKLAVMGVHGRGRGLLSGFCAFPEVEIAYICDPDSEVIPAAVKIVEGREKKTPKVVADFREALDDAEVDALVCAAPDHWHALATILACQAGKDVYVEKPVSHNIREGQAMVEAARKYNRVVQSGTQRRSGADIQAAIEEVRSGRLGDVHMARCWITSTRPNIGHVDPSEPPPHLNFNLWAGPGPADAYKTNLVHYHWHWRWDFGTGECGNNGIHALDLARWGMGIDAPKLVTCGGDKYSFDDDQETPDTQIAVFDFDGGCIQWEHRTWSKRGIDGMNFGIEFYGKDATLVSPGRGWKVYRGDKVVKEHAPADCESAHLRNFLECIVSREKPAADIEIGHHSAQMCHLANIAWRTRSTVRFDPQQGEIVGNPAAQALMGREYRKGFELPSTI